MSRVVYYRDLTNAAASPLPLGVMCDITVGDVYGLSLMARRRLPEEELESVGSLMRSGLAQPFEMLKTEFHWTWDQVDRRREAFAEVVRRHSASLKFTPLRETKVNVPTVLRLRPECIDDLSAWARDELSGKRNAEYWSLFGEQPQPTMPGPEANLKKRGAVIFTNPPTLAAA
jgi:hypothetical protein